MTHNIYYTQTPPSIVTKDRWVDLCASRINVLKRQCGWASAVRNAKALADIHFPNGLSPLQAAQTI